MVIDQILKDDTEIKEVMKSVLETKYNSIRALRSLINNEDRENTIKYAEAAVIASVSAQDHILGMLNKSSEPEPTQMEVESEVISRKEAILNEVSLE